MVCSLAKCPGKSSGVGETESGAMKKAPNLSAVSTLRTFLKSSCTQASLGRVPPASQSSQWQAGVTTASHAHLCDSPVSSLITSDGQLCGN